MNRRNRTLSLLVVVGAGLSLPGHAQTSSCNLGSVHVTDNFAAGPVPSWYHLALASTAGAPAACTANNGGQTNVRVILSWAAVPPACANAGFVQAMPVWGNRIDFTARRDP